MQEYDVDEDVLFDNQQALIKHQIYQARNQLKPPTHCLFCEDPLPKNWPSHFCDNGCATFYEREQHNKRVRGQA